MTLKYSNPKLPNARRRISVAGRLPGVALLIAFICSGRLCYWAIRWDSWARAESSKRSKWNMIASDYASFKGWQARRACWDRGVAAVWISGVAIAAGLTTAIIERIKGRRLSRALVLVVALNALPLAYFIWRWGPSFDHPYPFWAG